jgi:hypothetical protein
MPAFLVIIIWIAVIAIAAYACFWILGKMGVPAPFNLFLQILIGLVAIYLIAALFFPSLGVHFPLH